MPRRPIAPTLAAGVALTLAISGCGAGGSGVLSVKNAADTTTTPGITPTVTRTEIVTQTITAPQPTQTISHTTTVEVSPTTQTVHVSPTSETQTSDEVPWWAWVLIGLGVLGLVIGVVSMFRGHHRTDGGAPAAGAYPGGGAGPPPPVPPDRGPPLT